MAEMLLPVQYPVSTFHLASLLNHDVWNINGLIIPAESEIKDILFFYFSFLTDGDLILHQRGTVWRQISNPPVIIVTGAGVDSHNTLIR